MSLNPQLTCGFLYVRRLHDRQRPRNDHRVHRESLGQTGPPRIVILQGLTLAAVGFTLWALAYLINAFGRFTVLQGQSLQQAVDNITAQIGKAQAELVNRIADVQAQLDAAGVGEDIDLSSLTAAAQALDDVVPDAPAAA